MKPLKNILLLGLLIISSCIPKEQYYIKQVTFPENATLDEKLDMASRLVPTPQQLAWQQMELTAFLHFGINTFTGREWGNGTESPALFNPTAFDADQWVTTLKDAGFKMAIITAKHHDGFCLWPTATTEHSVKNSPWKDGKGDVVKELRDACHRHNIKFGVYLSPWDRNASCYGTPQYNTFFINQLTELLTNYGEVHEVWFDGANGEGPNGKKQEYDLQAYYKVIEELQPKAVTAIMGHDVRWVGNEEGLGRTTEWSATVLSPRKYPYGMEQNERLGVYSMAKDLGSRELLEKADHLFWYPSEVDVSIRPGWFYHPEEDNKVKSLKHLTDIYFQSVGYNSVLLLNIPPDTRGLINESDAGRLKEFGEYIRTTFKENLISSGSQSRRLSTGDSYEYKVKSTKAFNVISICEDISKGQRVESFKIEALENGEWKEIANGTTIGYKRLFRIPETTSDKIRLTILQCRGVAHISKMGVYYTVPIEEDTSQAYLDEIPTDKWKILSPQNVSEVIFDTNPDTYWTSTGLEPLVIDMNESVDIKGFIYTPVSKNKDAGLIYKYAFDISNDNKNWIKCECTGEFGNIENNPQPQYVQFGKSYTARYIRFTPLSEVKGRNYYSVAGLRVY